MDGKRSGNQPNERYLRHPGYVGMIVSLLATPLVLGSLWALIPAGLASGAYVVRTASAGCVVAARAWAR